MFVHTKVFTRETQNVLSGGYVPTEDELHIGPPFTLSFGLLALSLVATSNTVVVVYPRAPAILCEVTNHKASNAERSVKPPRGTAHTCVHFLAIS